MGWKLAWELTRRDRQEWRYRLDMATCPTLHALHDWLIDKMPESIGSVHTVEQCSSDKYFYHTIG